MSSKGVTKYNIKKNGVDICKIIFTKAKDIIGRFDIKISFYDEKYKIKVHKLFTYRSQELLVDNIESKQISYHYGRIGSVRIQVKEHKNTTAKSEQLVYNLVPPNDYSKFPIPLFKLEINNSNDEPAILQNCNKKHSGINIELGNNNTVEVYMANHNDRKLTSEDIAKMYTFLGNIPIEYFASNGGRVGYEKNRFYYNNSGEHLMKKELTANDFNLLFDGYHNCFFDSKVIETTITFIENELYEDIILNTSINPIVNIDGKECRIPGYINGGKYFPNFNYETLIKDTVGEKIWNDLAGNAQEQQDFFSKVIDSQKRLTERLKKFSDDIERKKEKLRYKIDIFLYAIIELNKYYSKKYSNGELGDNLPWEILWMINYQLLNCEEINILLGKYLNINNFKIIKCKMSPDKVENPINDNNEEKIIYEIKDRKKIPFNYCYLEYDSVFNIHPLSFFINNILGENEIPVVCRGNNIYVEEMMLSNLAQKLKSKKYNCSDVSYRIINLEQEFKTNPILDKVYVIILNKINEIDTSKMMLS